MKTLALVTAFPPGSGSLNEYALHLANAFARRPDLDRIIILADKMDVPLPELNLDPKIEVRRVWTFNDMLSVHKITKAIDKCKPDNVLFNLQTASFGDKEIPAALGLLAPALTQLKGHGTGVLMHNLIDAVDLAQTNLANQKLRQKIVELAGTLITKIMLKAGYVSVTLDSFHEILTSKYKAKNAFMVPHGSFPIASTLPTYRLSERSNKIVTMGKFGTYKKLERLIFAIQNINKTRPEEDKISLIIGGSDHPATPGYLEGLANMFKSDDAIKFHGYVAEEDVEGFFKQARLAVFDYDSTTGSSGVLHQAAIYGTPPVYPMMGDFVDVTEREGLSGFHYTPLDQDSLERSIEQGLSKAKTAQSIADNNLDVSKGVTMDTVAAAQLRLMHRVNMGWFLKTRISDNKVVLLTAKSA